MASDRAISSVVACRLGIVRFSLDLGGERLLELAECLSPDERERARRMKTPRDADRFVAARGMLRQLLAAGLGARAADLVFEYGPFGKPRVAGLGGGTDFSLSHSGGTALLAISVGARVGVDLEELHDDLSFESVAGVAFCPAEVEGLMKVPAEDRARAFYRCWTCKEACVKATGQGLSVDPSCFEVVVSAKGPARLLSVCGSRLLAEDWTVGHLSLGPGLVASFAAECPPRRVRASHLLCERVPGTVSAYA